MADSLEADWNDKLRQLNQKQQEYQHQRQIDRLQLDQQTRDRILALVNDLPQLWNGSNTANRERKRILRLLIQDVTLIKEKDLIVNVRFRGGATKSLRLHRPLPAWKQRQSSDELIAEIDRLLEHYTDKQIAKILNERGVRSGKENSCIG